MERGRIQGLPKFFWVPPIISGTDFKFCKKTSRFLPTPIRIGPVNVAPLKTFSASEDFCLTGAI